MKNLTYTQAYNELINIQAALEKNRVPVDQLSKTVERADFLIQLCKQTRKRNNIASQKFN